jgi:hypothetical protein
MLLGAVVDNYDRTMLLVTLVLGILFGGRTSTMVTVSKSSS